tara:strand:- start:3229 stop:4224 length:996 start_codon:yes stop_codon:yes gene_type:complete
MQKMLGVSLVLALCVIMMGAYTRLSDAGLSCPDWPNCYGYPTVTQAQDHLILAEQSFPERPLDAGKAWLEMIHRYIAGALGCFVFFMVALSTWREKKIQPLPTALLALVGMQVTLGMLTVTMNLVPWIVTGHLLGGFSLFSLLWIWFLSYRYFSIDSDVSQKKRLMPYAIIALVALVGQIFLGGWMASNYAATACTELPFCEGQWWENLQWMQAMFGFLGNYTDYEFGVLNYNARMTIHVLHRFGALLAFACIFILVLRMLYCCQSLILRRAAWIILGLLTVQLSLGVSHIIFHFPVYIGVAHNAVAALLLLSCLFVLYTLMRYQGRAAYV